LYQVRTRRIHSMDVRHCKMSVQDVVENRQAGERATTVAAMKRLSAKTAKSVALSGIWIAKTWNGQGAWPAGRSAQRAAIGRARRARASRIFGNGLWPQRFLVARQRGQRRSRRGGARR